ncbi:barstar family protein [Paludifilum halophilum]|uniref:Barstar (barnase inhibitor) domain-containing protein n=1 Tax=Paludifilum halophilum TaxID=1642702 RepID=A0A235B1R3_9BACL|nr:barstar family protein [Paludifilum halophilum]OYD06224.1 hypothetical protein CHM34_17340 [Paludifilum halophilum]
MIKNNVLKNINQIIENKNLILVGNKSVPLSLIKQSLEEEIQTLHVYELSGRKMKSKEDFYNEFYTKIPLINHPGKNLDAVRDCLLTLELYNKQKHLIFWKDADVLLKNNTKFFYEVVDLILGTLKELTVGDEIEKENSPEEFKDWIPTWVGCLITGDLTLLQNEYDYSILKSLFWEEMFFELDSNTTVFLTK